MSISPNNNSIYQIGINQGIIKIFEDMTIDKIP